MMMQMKSVSKRKKNLSIRQAALLIRLYIENRKMEEANAANGIPNQLSREQLYAIWAMKINSLGESEPRTPEEIGARLKGDLHRCRERINFERLPNHGCMQSPLKQFPEYLEELKNILKNSAKRKYSRINGEGSLMPPSAKRPASNEGLEDSRDQDFEQERSSSPMEPYNCFDDSNNCDVKEECQSVAEDAPHGQSQQQHHLIPPLQLPVPNFLSVQQMNGEHMNPVDRFNSFLSGLTAAAAAEIADNSGSVVDDNRHSSSTSSFSARQQLIDLELKNAQLQHEILLQKRDMNEMKKEYLTLSIMKLKKDLDISSSTNANSSLETEDPQTEDPLAAFNLLSKIE